MVQNTLQFGWPFHSLYCSITSIITAWHHFSANSPVSRFLWMLMMVTKTWGKQSLRTLLNTHNLLWLYTELVMVAGTASRRLHSDPQTSLHPDLPPNVWSSRDLWRTICTIYDALYSGSSVRDCTTKQIYVRMCDIVYSVQLYHIRLLFSVVLWKKIELL